MMSKVSPLSRHACRLRGLCSRLQIEQPWSMSMQRSSRLQASAAATLPICRDASRRRALAGVFGLLDQVLRIDVSRPIHWGGSGHRVAKTMTVTGRFYREFRLFRLFIHQSRKENVTRTAALQRSRKSTAVELVDSAAPAPLARTGLATVLASTEGVATPSIRTGQEHRAAPL
jgi:hypothetical protein